MQTFSLLFAWSDNDTEQGEYGTIVRAENYDEAEAKGRADMRANHISNHCDADASEEEIAESCAEYENTDWQGNVTFGGRLIEAHVGAIWKADEMEGVLRRLIESLRDLERLHGTPCDGTVRERMKEAEAFIAELDAI